MPRTSSFFALLALAGTVVHAEPLHDCTLKTEPTYSKVARVVHNWIHPHHRVYPKPMMCGEPDMITVDVVAPPLHDDITDAPALTAQGGLYGGYFLSPGVYVWPATIGEPETVPASVWHDGRDPIETYERPKPQCVPEPATWLVMLSGAIILYVMRRRYVRA